MRPATLLFTAVALAAAPAVAAALDVPGDPASGERLAERWCGSCHQLSPADARPRTGAPGFPQIARLPSTTALALRVFLRTSHANMPNIQLTSAQTDDLIAFILSMSRSF
jgi:cytochrome c